MRLHKEIQKYTNVISGHYCFLMTNSRLSCKSFNDFLLITRVTNGRSQRPL